ncbi:MAG: amidophosphoribosyltransferase [Gammaproteobacteria bacterium]|nr:amidophosphoribosyltransferase [Gammaproteobacteria bacterium]
MIERITTDRLSADKPKEECAVFGVFGARDAAAHCVLGLHALQHRGQEASGIVSTDGSQFYQRLAFGRVGDQFSSNKVVNSLKGSAAIGHNRYSTSGSKHSYSNIQPIFAELDGGGMALAHNGNLTNARLLRQNLVKDGSIFRTSMDTEVVVHLIAVSRQKTLVERLVEALTEVRGAYSMILLTEDAMIGARDPAGVRPLVLGQLDGAWILASETCAFDIIGAELVREVEPGEIIRIDKNGCHSIKPLPQFPPKFCIFEFVYFSRPDSFIHNRHVYEARKNMGKELALEDTPEIDVVVPVPDSGVPAALGYAEQSGIPFQLGIIRNHYVGRTFIEPTDEIRHLGVRLKHNANRAVIEGKRVCLVDDSLVRGTTLRKVVQMIREAGAREIHIRISCPEWIAPCHYGVDTPKKEELLASSNSLEQMREFLGVESLAFLSIESLYRAVGECVRNNQIPQYCDACFTGEYPIAPAAEETEKAQLLNTISTDQD